MLVMAFCTSILTAIVLLVFIWAVYHNIFSQTLRFGLPPGPRGTFFSGVKYQLPTSEPWKKYAEWSRQYGAPIISFRVYNRQIIVLNDHKVVRDLFDKRAKLYSDRPKAWMYQELCDRRNSVFNISSRDERHTEYRKLLQGGLGTRATQQYWPLLESEAINLLQGLSQSPELYERHIRRNAAAVIMKVAYGYTVLREDDFFIGVAEEAAKISGWATAPGRWLVDYYPILRFVPSWLPGAGFKRQGEAWRLRLDSLSTVPHEWVKRQMASGSYFESFTSRLLRSDANISVSAEKEDIIKWCAGGLYAGAADTTVSAIISFVMLMSLHPDVQRRAQVEIDKIVGRDSETPRASDLSQMVYLLAILKEVLRFAPIANLALPHKVVEEDEYDGYRIPKDATVMANVWAIMHDPHTYPNPDIFNPDRFFPSKANTTLSSLPVQPDPRSFSFGFGRRTCPGIQFAETTLLLTMASILSRFNIVCPAHGHKAGTPKLEYTTGITSHIKPFDIRITPRSNRT